MQADTSEIQLLEPACKAASADNLAQSLEARSGEPSASSQWWQSSWLDTHFLSFITIASSITGPHDVLSEA